MSENLERRSLIGKLLAPVAVGAAMAVVSLGAVACPSFNAYDNFKDSPIVGASFVFDGIDTTTFFFDSADRSPVNGVPGLIEYCVYADPIPAASALTPIVLGANGKKWQATVKANQGYFSFNRPNGNPTNVPLGGAQDVVIGTALWSGTAELLMHINDAAECDRLYGGNPGTCWVKPVLACTPETPYEDDPECYCDQHPLDNRCNA